YSYRCAFNGERITGCRGRTRPIGRSSGRIGPIGIRVRVSRESGIILFPLRELTLSGVGQAVAVAEGLLIDAGVAAEDAEIGTPFGGCLRTGPRDDCSSFGCVCKPIRLSQIGLGHLRSSKGRPGFCGVLVIASELK